MEKYQYGAHFAYLASFTRVLTLVFIDRGFTATQIGLMQSSHRMISTAINPFIAAYVDATKRARVTYLQSIACALPSFLCLLFTGSNFSLTLLVLVVAAIMRAPVVTLADPLVLAMVGYDENRWGKSRAVGAATWGIMNVIVSLVMEMLGLDTMFVAYCVASLGLFLISRHAPESCGETKTDVTFAGVWHIFAQSKQTVAFFCNLVLLGSGFSMVEGMLFLVLNREMGASYLLCGVSVLITVTFEIPIFANAQYLLRVFGTVGLITLGQLAWVARALFYAWMPNPYWVLLIEPLHGVTFALVWTAAVQHTRKLAPAGLEASAQTLLSLMFTGIGSWLGALVGGGLFEYVGYKPSFIIFAGVIAVSLMVYVAVTLNTPPPKHARLSGIAQETSVTVARGIVSSAVGSNCGPRILSGIRGPRAGEFDVLRQDSDITDVDGSPLDARHIDDSPVDSGYLDDSPLDSGYLDDSPVSRDIDDSPLEMDDVVFIEKDDSLLEMDDVVFVEHDDPSETRNAGSYSGTR